MASNKDFTLKRHNGTDYDTLLPTTHMGQVYTNSGLSKTLDQYLSETYLTKLSRGAENGVASLDAWGHVPADQLGPYISGGLRIQGNMSTAAMDSVGELLGALEAIVVANTGTARGELIGYAWVTTLGFSLTEGTLPANTAYTINPGDEGDTIVPITLEAGDILFVSKYELVGATHTWTLSVINNTYGVATTLSPGIVQLADPDHISGMQDAAGDPGVVTANLLALLSTGGDSHAPALANQIALMGHHHDGRYQAKDSDLTAIAELATADGNFIVGDGTKWTVESGGTARASLGLSIGLDVQAYDVGLKSIADLTTVANKMLYTVGSDNYATTTLTSFARGLLDDSNYSEAQSTLGLTIGINVQAYSANLDTIAGLSPVAGNFIVGGGTSWTIKTGSAARSSLDVFSTTEISNLLANRPTIYYDTLSGTTGSLIIDLD